MLKPITVEFRQADVKIKRANGEVISFTLTLPLQDTAPTASQWRKVLEETEKDSFIILSNRDFGIQSATRSSRIKYVCWVWIKRRCISKNINERKPIQFDFGNNLKHFNTITTKIQKTLWQENTSPPLLTHCFTASTQQLTNPPVGRLSKSPLT